MIAYFSLKVVLTLPKDLRLCYSNDYVFLLLQVTWKKIEEFHGILKKVQEMGSFVGGVAKYSTTSL